jgi:hypothetical protein|tara:strand:+ start:86 stop:277 length:192 start_codon:yes stop_codon:yes gene_type:complete
VTDDIDSETSIKEKLAEDEKTETKLDETTQRLHEEMMKLNPSIADDLANLHKANLILLFHYLV